MSGPAEGAERLYPLLPAVYRIADHDRGEPLRALLGVLEEPYRAVEDDVRALYEDWFVETCAPWLVPYIGDLVGVRDTLDPHGVIPTVRARVANAVAYARRKGPAWVLAHVARDVTGWPARVVESFPRLAVTQDLADVHPRRGRTADLRAPAAAEAGTPFDGMARTVEVGAGRWAADRVALFLWRLRSYPLTLSQPREVHPGCFALCPFGADTPLFLPPRTQPPFGAEPGPWDVPGPVDGALMERVLEEEGRHDHPWARGEYPVLRVWAGEGPARAVPCALAVADLGDWDVSGIGPGARAGRPAPPRAAVDPARGRVAFLDGARPAWVRAEWSYGFSAELGGGPYARPAPDPAPPPGAFAAVVGGRPRGPGEAVAGSVAGALEEWMRTDSADCVVRLGDSAIHPAPAEVVVLPPGRRLWIVAAPGERPCLAGTLNLRGLARSGVILDGVLVDGTVRLAGTLDLVASHCTLAPPVPGVRGEPRRSVAAQADFTGSVTLRGSVLGPLSVPRHAAGVSLADCIVAGGVYAAAWGGCDADARTTASLHVERCTVFGMVMARTLTARDSLFTDAVLVDDAAAGGLTCCYAPPGGRTPRRDRCQPAPGGEGARPFFTSTRYGDPSFAQLDVHCAAAIRTGAGDGGEMGAFHRLDTPRREANLRVAVAEFLPNGLEAVVSYVT
ncbi:MAG TPA: hypothetical protein VFT45_07000 [Longimicrobium sp.]|nr:hypothetical protein [Longimicrobium sp.]